MLSSNYQISKSNNIIPAFKGIDEIINKAETKNTEFNNILNNIQDWKF